MGELAWLGWADIRKGGPTSGNFLHSGKRGETGGSDAGGGHAGLPGPTPLAKVARLRLARFEQRQEGAARFGIAQHDPRMPMGTDAHDDRLGEAKRWGNQQSIDWEEALTGYEREGLTVYTGSGYSSINRVLRGQEDAWSSSSHYDERAKGVEEALDKAHLKGKAGAIAYRSAGRTVQSQLAGMTPGTVFRDNGFCSTSLRSKIAEPDLWGSGAQCKLFIPGGTKGAMYVGGVSSQSHSESEVLLQRGTTFRFLGSQMKDGRTVPRADPDAKYYLLEVVGNKRKPLPEKGSQATW